MDQQERRLSKKFEAAIQDAKEGMQGFFLTDLLMQKAEKMPRDVLLKSTVMAALDSFLTQCVLMEKVTGSYKEFIELYLEALASFFEVES